jgi:hypothetical protein
MAPSVIASGSTLASIEQVRHQMDKRMYLACEGHGAQAEGSTKAAQVAMGEPVFTQ